jgi:penicillin amidase
MKLLKRLLLSVLVLLLLTALVGFFFIRHLSRRALPDYNENVLLEGLKGPVEVYRDAYAIPHIYASNEKDLYLAVGYLMAQDRLWQMDLLRHVTEGRLSEIFGAAYADTDLLLRALRFSEKSEKILARSDSSLRIALEAFASGVNQYIQTHQKQLPPEFALLKYGPEKWEPLHTVNMVGYMAWDLKAGWSEIILTKIKELVDSVRYRELLPDLIKAQPVVYPSLSQEHASQTVLPDLMMHLAKLQNLGADVLEASNNWAVTGERSNTGMPLLANDMHLSLNIPGIWYQMHHVVEGSLNVTGLVLPGTPFVVCGHNDSIAWGMTNTYVDNMDFYEETVNQVDSTQYLYNGEWKNFTYQKEIIKISGGTEVQRTLCFSHRGPVVSSFRKIDSHVVTMHWVGDEMSNEISTVYQLNRANNWNNFRDALKTFTSISQNVVYADKKGNIGLFCAAGIPIRKRDVSFGILPGRDETYDWKGYVPFDELPFLFNPPDGFVVSANNRTAPPDYPYHIGTWFAQPGRYKRITELLSAKDRYSVKDFCIMQIDQQSKLAELYMPVFLQALNSLDTLTVAERDALEVLRQWDYRMGADSPAAAIFESMYMQLIENIFEDELGEKLFNSFVGVTSVVRNATDQVLENPGSLWFDIAGTPEKEEAGSIIGASFKKTVASLQSKYGDEVNQWKWGNLHQLLLAHPLSAVKLLDRLFQLNRGPFAVGGSFHTVAPFTYDNSKPFSPNHGASHRHVFDLSQWDNSLTVLPTGNSGIPSSPHYCDQTQLYLRGQYHADFFSRKKVLENARYHMSFKEKP